MTEQIDLLGNIVQRSDDTICVNIYHDEREVPNKWLYHGYLFIECSKIDNVLDRLTGFRDSCNWERELHFSNLKRTRDENNLASEWLQFFCTPPEEMYFYLFGVNYHNLEKSVWDTPRDYKIYNKFFGIGLYSAIKWFFVNPTVNKNVNINNIFSDKKVRRDMDNFHTYAIDEILYRAIIKNEGITFNSLRIIEIESDHRKEQQYPDHSHFIQFCDLIIGAISQALDNTSTHEGKCKCAEILLSSRVLYDLLRDTPMFDSNYYKKYALSFFPKERLSKEQILNKDYDSKRLHYQKRQIQYSNYKDPLSGKF